MKHRCPRQPTLFLARRSGNTAPQNSEQNSDRDDYAIGRDAGTEQGRQSGKSGFLRDLRIADGYDSGQWE